MINRLSGSNASQVQDASLLNVGQQKAVEKVDGGKTASPDGGASSDLVDQINISPEARLAYEQEKDALRYSRLAQRIKSPDHADRVSQLKNMVDNGRINEYLRSVNTDRLADSLLSSPVGSFLK